MTKLHVLRPRVPTGPLTRGECSTWVLPCRLRSCRYNLGHESLTRSKGRPSSSRPLDGCALDVADAGPNSQEAVASAIGVTLSGEKAIEARAIRRAARNDIAIKLNEEHEERGDVDGARYPNTDGLAPGGDRRKGKTA